MLVARQFADTARTVGQQIWRAVDDVGPCALNTDFLYVKLDGGRGFFGGKKAVFASYVAYCESDLFEVGPVFKSWAFALAAINNLYRNAGLLKGPAL